MYLMIRNPGVADYRAFSLIGASCTRYSTRPGTIGQFGSGSKYAIALLLRNNIKPIVTSGNLKMEFFSEAEKMKNNTFDRVCVKYSGSDEGKTKNATESLGYATQMGEKNWQRLSMAVREFVSNAIDGCIENGGDYRDMTIEMVDHPRAKKDHTCVYIPCTYEIEQVYQRLGTMFLHIGSPSLLNQKILPKSNAPGTEGKILIYKHGVLVNYMNGNSVFDYNLGDELALDESRNAESWDVTYAVARVMKNASVNQLTTLIRRMADGAVWEGELDTNYVVDAYNMNEKSTEERNQRYQEAWKEVYGERGAVTIGGDTIGALVQEKGYTPVHLKSVKWSIVFEQCGVLSDGRVLTKNEKEGKIDGAPTEAHLESVDKMWQLFERFNLTNEKVKPNVKSFYSIMDASSQTWGFYNLGEDTIYLHKELGGDLLHKVTLEELVHYVTGARDNSRDIQDYLFRLVLNLYQHLPATN